MKITSKKVIGTPPYGELIAADVVGFDSPYYYFEQSKEIVGVVVVSKGRVLLNKQFRIPVQKDVFDLPAGLVEKGESLEEAAKRELEEETGFVADRLIKLGSFMYHPARSTARCHLFFCDSIQKGKRNLDKTEQIKAVWFDFPSCINKFLEEGGHDFTMISGLVMVERYLQEEKRK
ncbi:hypothetical protein CMO92_02075 [Candidatus Woesearchaeota archaeon]|nr:hypothetical protein [Candidatus Woesearchaeota archaeon]|tara:strand:- start:58 stop:585 length:528 start_codon:yes stop_codon:yes gene_type:complete